jgi:hypothetical protein
MFIRGRYEEGVRSKATSSVGQTVVVCIVGAFLAHVAAIH